MEKKLIRPLAVVASALLALACDSPEPRAVPDAADLPLRGTKPISPMGKVDFTMPDASGRSYDFHAETEGKIALLFFGYTYCPDICPIHMATLASALEELEPADREKIEVVFVTVDPERDTPERLASWLAAFDSSFVGVRGTPEAIEEALAFYRYPPPERSAEGQVYTVGHPALIYAFTPDGLGRAMYGAETSRQVWVHDLEMMAGYPWAAWDAGKAPTREGAGAGEPPAAEQAASDRSPALAVVGDIVVLDAYAPAPAAGDRTSVYLSLRNSGTRADTLVSLSSPVAGVGSLHDMRNEDGMMRMVPLEHILLPAGETVTLAPGQRHGMLEEVAEGSMEPGSTVEVTLTLAGAGPVTVAVRVVRYRDVGG